MSQGRVEIIHITKIKPGTIEKNSSTIYVLWQELNFAMPVQCSDHRAAEVADKFWQFKIPPLYISGIRSDHAFACV